VIRLNQHGHSQGRPVASVHDRDRQGDRRGDEGRRFADRSEMMPDRPAAARPEGRALHVQHREEPQTRDAPRHAIRIPHSKFQIPNYTTSNNPAAPIPPPTHMVTTTRLAPRRRPSMSAWPTSRAPDMPYGCPSAIAPPFTL